MKSTTKGLIAIVVLLVILAIVGEVRPPSKAKKAPDRTQACAMAEHFAREALKSPATAKFQACDGQTITQAPAQPPVADGTGDLWNVAGYVDSQNSFGALLRSRFRITMTYKGGKLWQRESIDIQ